MANDTSLYFDFLERRNTVIPAAGKTAAAIAALDRATRTHSTSMSRSNQRTAQELFRIDNVLRNTARRMASRVLLIGAAIAAVAGHAVALTGALWPMLGALGAIPAVSVAGVAGLAALIVGFKGLGAAMQRTDTGARTEAAAKAYGKLSNAGKALADTFHRLGPAWRSVQQATQQSLLVGVAGDVRLLSERWLPVMQRQLPAIAAGWNNMFRSIARVATGAGFIADMDRSLGLQAVMWQRIGNAFGPFFNGFRHWVSVGSEFLPRLGSWVDRLARRFELWSIRVRESGEAYRWIDQALVTGHKFNELIKSWGRSLFEVFRLGQDKSLLDNLVAGSKAFERWLATAEGQQRITRMWEKMREAGSAAWVALKEIFDVISQLDLTPLVVVLKLVGAALGVVADNMGLVNDVAPVLVAAYVGMRVATLATTAVMNLYTFALGASTTAMRVASVAARGLNLALGVITSALILLNMRTEHHVTNGQGLARTAQLVGSAFRDASKELQTYSDTLRAQTDPLFRYQQAQEAVTAATQRYNEVLAQYGPNSDQAQQALQDLAQAELALIDATTGLATVNGPELTRWLEEMVRTGNLSRESADLLLATINKIPDAIAKVDGSRIRLYFEPWTTNMSKGGLQPASKPVYFHDGGVVPGPRGSEVAAVLQAGETVLPLDAKPKAPAAAAPRVELVINSGGSRMDDLIVEMIRRYVRVQGNGNVQTAFGASGR